MPMLDLYGSHVGTYMGPMWAANMGPRWVVQPGSIWVPSGLPHILSNIRSNLTLSREVTKLNI
ncbi:hypothetical protein DPMN_154674 [Dreissena polymorpha]|uniref:Uncharacterized protein n=1 Tax=Dreissena polymorpha TaxID=45954 RepID=A0A9D4FR99_DREPO|nr:hypothetical protein DPMN_154674 [Dreissena polymorpha]